MGEPPPRRTVRGGVPLSERKRGAVNDDNAETRIGGLIQPQPDGCWLYAGRTDRYGTSRIAGEHVTVHRFVYETLVGRIPPGHDLHHTCETPGCCNPDHLRPLTPRDHSRVHRCTPARWPDDDLLRRPDDDLW